MRPATLTARKCIFCCIRQSPWASQSTPSLRSTRAQFSLPSSFNTHSTDHGWIQALGSRYHSTKAWSGKLRRPTKSYRQDPSRARPPASRTRRVGKRMHVEDSELLGLLFSRLASMHNQCSKDTFRLETGLAEDDAVEKVKKFEKDVRDALKDWRSKPTLPPLFAGVRKAYQEMGIEGIDAQLKFALQGFIANEAFSQEDLVNQAKVADLRYPYEWYPFARALQRKLHIHIGPTNSGKTYHALQRLEAARTGVYAGPLRLLAHEVYTRLNARGKPCNLITGDEMIFSSTDESAPIMNSCTVEMVPYHVVVDVAVVDEIQMIGDTHRGWAWTQALLGVKAKEVHMCGEARALPLIQELAAAMGEELIVHRYERLSPLRMGDSSLKGDLKKLKKGDCVVAFSRRAIHSLKKEVEQATKKKAAVVYGSLPPEVRAQQARLFNNDDNDYDLLVASDAIGMGLNLSIKRLIFESTFKFDGIRYAQMPIPNIKQIAGRAGRYRIASQAVQNSQDSEKNVSPPSVGIVTALEDIDMPIIRTAMNTDPEPIRAAGLLPPDHYILRFASYFPPRTPFSYILLRLHEIARMHWRFNLCQLHEQTEIADTIQQVPELSVSERMIFCMSPGTPREPGMKAALVAFAKCVACRSGGQLLDIPEIQLEVLEHKGPIDAEYLRLLEGVHKAVVLYLWLSYRFSSIFTSQAMAFHVKELLQAKIDEALTTAGLSRQARLDLLRRREAAVKATQSDSKSHSTQGSDPATADGIAHNIDNEAGEEPLFDSPRKDGVPTDESKTRGLINLPAQDMHYQPKGDSPRMI